jgi:hypothetical protein
MKYIWAQTRNVWSTCFIHGAWSFCCIQLSYSSKFRVVVSGERTSRGKFVKCDKCEFFRQAFSSVNHSCTFSSTAFVFICMSTVTHNNQQHRLYIHATVKCISLRHSNPVQWRWEFLSRFNADSLRAHQLWAASNFDEISWDFRHAHGNILSTLMQLLFSFNRGMRMRKTLT